MIGQISLSICKSQNDPLPQFHQTPFKCVFQMFKYAVLPQIPSSTLSFPIFPKLPSNTLFKCAYELTEHLQKGPVGAKMSSSKRIASLKKDILAGELSIYLHLVHQYTSLSIHWPAYCSQIIHVPSITIRHLLFPVFLQAIWFFPNPNPSHIIHVPSIPLRHYYYLYCYKQSHAIAIRTTLSTYQFLVSDAQQVTDTKNPLFE